MSKIETLKQKIILKFDWIYNIFIEDNTLIIEETYEMSKDEKNTDDCCDIARENGEMIIKEFPELEILEYYCHRSKYAIVELKIKKE